MEKWNLSNWENETLSGNHGNQTILVGQLIAYLCSNGYHCWTHCSTTVTIETKVHSLMKIGELFPELLVNFLQLVTTPNSHELLRGERHKCHLLLVYDTEMMYVNNSQIICKFGSGNFFLHIKKTW